MKRLIILALLAMASPLYARVFIFTYAYNRTDFIRLQFRCFKKFLQDDYEFIVFNDAKSGDAVDAIPNTCEELGLRCIRIPQEIHSQPYLPRPNRGPFANYQQGSVRNCNVVQYSLNVLGFQHDDVVALFDSDMFLIKPFSITEYMRGKDLAGYKRMCNDFWEHNCNREHPGRPPFGYIWIGIAFLNMATMPNKNSIDFNCGYIDGNHVDAGGFTYNYIRNNPLAKIEYFNRIQIPELWCNSCLQNRQICTHNRSTLERYGFNEEDIKFLQHAPVFQTTLPPEWFVEYYLDGCFMHFRGGTRDTVYEKKETYIIPFVHHLLNL